MIPLLRQAHRRWLVFAGALLLYVAALLLVLSLLSRLGSDKGDGQSPVLFGEAAAWAANLGLGLILARKLLSLRVRPNEGDPEARKQLGQRLAMTKEAFARMLDPEG
jgi:hypothetical protein